MMILQQLEQAFEQAKARLASGRLYLACSGGRDSLALAYACHQLYQAGVIDQLPILLHVHHGWQSVNDDWARLVQNWAVKHDFECQILSVQLEKLTETHARLARYEAFGRVLQDDDVLLLAHHANDQAETVLMRLIDGAGVSGLSAMKEWQAKSLGAKRFWLWRPWLSVLRDAISDYATWHGLPYVDDPTNESDLFVRGVLRQQVLPVLTKLNPQAIANIAKSAALLGESAQIIQHAIQDWQPDIKEMTLLPYQAVLDIAQLNKMPAIMHASCIHDWLKRGATQSPNGELIAQVSSLIQRVDNDHQSRLFWQDGASGVMICRHQDKLYRYRYDVWLCQMQSCQIQWCDDRLMWCWQHLTLSWQIPDGHQLIKVEVVTRDDAVQIGKHTYRAKKLHQRLRLPVWLRSQLYQLTIVNHHQSSQYLIAPMMIWQIPTGEQCNMGVWRYFAPDTPNDVQ